MEQLNFLHNCKRQRILPNSINYQPPLKTTYAQQIAQSNGRRMLNVLISNAHNRLRIYRHTLQEHRQTVTRFTTQSDAKNHQYTKQQRTIKNLQNDDQIIILRATKDAKQLSWTDQNTSTKSKPSYKTPPPTNLSTQIPPKRPPTASTRN